MDQEFDIDGIRFDVGNEVSHRFLEGAQETIEEREAGSLSAGRNLA